MIFSYGHWSNEFMKNKLAAIEGIFDGNKCDKAAADGGT